MSLFNGKQKAQGDEHFCPVCGAETYYSEDDLAWECLESAGDDYEEYAAPEEQNSFF